MSSFPYTLRFLFPFFLSYYYHYQLTANYPPRKLRAFTHETVAATPRRDRAGAGWGVLQYIRTSAIAIEPQRTGCFSYKSESLTP